LRGLKTLKNLGLAHPVSVEPSMKGGKDKIIWEITFRGLLEVFGEMLLKEEVKSIARIHKEKWIIFQEWEYFHEFPEIQECIIVFILYFSSVQSTILRQPFVKIKFHAKRMGEFHEKWPELFGSTIAHTEETLKTKATRIALGLDLVFNQRIWADWIINDKEHEIYKLWILCLKNKRLKEFIDLQFEVEEQKDRTMLEYKRLFNQLLT
jgi:hypothetical protein